MWKPMVDFKFNPLQMVNETFSDQIDPRFSFLFPDPILKNESSESENPVEINPRESNQSPVSSEQLEKDTQRQTIIPTVHLESVVNHNHEDNLEKPEQTNEEAIVKDNNQPRKKSLKRNFFTNTQIAFRRKL